jgi:hypothetical protein
MPRPAGSRNVSLDQQIDAITNKIKQRMDSLQQEIDSKQRELEHLSDRYAQLTGAAPAGRRRPRNIGPNGKRIRRLGVNVEWIGQQLSNKPMTLKQLQDLALRTGRSALSVMTVLRANQSKFKSTGGSKDPHQRGRAAQVWSTK